MTELSTMVGKAKEPESLTQSRVIRVAAWPEPPPQEFDVPGLVPRGKTTSIYGDGGTGKSYLAMHMAVAVAQGSEFLGFKCERRNVLYLDYEEDQEEFLRRAYQVTRGNGLDVVPQGLHYCECTTSIRTMKDELTTEIDRLDIGFVILDSMGPAGDGEMELSQDTISVMQDIRDLKITVLVLDHESKTKGRGQYGSTYKKNLSRSQIHVESIDAHEGLVSLRLTHTKMNSGPLHPPIPVQLRFEDGAVVLERGDFGVGALTQKNRARDRVMDALTELGRGTAKQIAGQTGLKLGTVRNELGPLRKQGRVKTAEKSGREDVWEPIWTQE